MNKKLFKKLLLPTMLITMLTSCKGKERIQIIYDGSDKPVLNAIKEVKKVIKNSNIKLVDSNPNYTIKILDSNSQLGKEAYTITRNESEFNICGGDIIGTMYGVYQIAESIELNGTLKSVQSQSESPYLLDRGFRLNPHLDLRTPSYTANGDSTRNNQENVWDLDFWDGLFSMMSKLRYNIFEFSETCTLPSMLEVPGYEDCALEDVYYYTGEYDDSYYGNSTNMFRSEHLNEGNYYVFKKMTIQEKSKHWQDVIQLAHDYGLKFMFSYMNIYTFAENGKYGITSDRANETTKDYFQKAFTKFLETFDIDLLKVSAGENMDYPANTKSVTEQWIYDVYGKAVEKSIVGKKDDFTLVYDFNNDNWPLWKNLNITKKASTRYADTHMYSKCTKPTYSQARRDSLPAGVKDLYNLRNEDAYHFTWADVEWSREFIKNMKQEKSDGFCLGSAGYFMGKEYCFKDESLNGGYYYDRHFANYTIFGRFSYNPDLPTEYLDSLVYNRFKNVNKNIVDIAWKAMQSGSRWLLELQNTYYYGGTDSSWYPETCQSHPNFGGYVGIKRFYNADNAYLGGDALSIAEYARFVKQGVTQFDKITPLETAENLHKIANETRSLVENYNKAKGKKSVELNNIVLDQETISYLSDFYAYKLKSAVALRLYNDTKNISKQNEAKESAQKALEAWTKYPEFFLSRFKVERFARVGIVDPSAYIDDVKKDITTIEKWVCREL